ncbi:hypothetical protein DY000_02034730 [Brassica cretica]|uniref:Uncharacterized protein n=1 Tax=Brassica cretica TaxID=69181 RepID=A0ABQ7DKW3_BRACR|nr:hypothetical protein DY000_02034730 [Brassica cretica]
MYWIVLPKKGDEQGTELCEPSSCCVKHETVRGTECFLSGIWGFPLTSKKLSMSEVKLSTRTRGGRESYVKRTNDDERGEGGEGEVRRNQMITR